MEMNELLITMQKGCFILGTRLRYEKMIRDRFPSLRQVRAYSPKKFTVTIYAGDGDGALSDSTSREIENFLKEHGQAHLLHEVKPYTLTVDDQIPQITDLPEPIKYIALYGGLNQKGIIESLNLAFPFLKLQLAKLENDILTIWTSSDVQLSEAEKELLDQYLYEIIPLGISVKIV
jgi:hypothetical protein